MPHDGSWRSASWRTQLRRRLLTWFTTSARDLPWRKTRDPYAIWVSEVMLQQTQVATVIPYFERFLRDYPTPAALAAADEAEVLRRWEGLGYYRRAKQLHAAAKRITAEHGGRFPETFEAVLALPGIGRYTAGAVLSISRDQRLPVVEANTLRLYSRLIALRQPPTATAPNRLLWEVAAAILPRQQAGRFNQAAMELGALLCTPRNPDCERCPLRSLCPTRREGLQEEIPGKVRTLQYEDRSHVAVVAQHEDRFFLRRCPPGGHWAGLWDFPRYDLTPAAALPGDALAAEVERRFAAEFGFAVRLGEKLKTLRHGVTRFRITLDAFTAEANRREADSAECGWYQPHEILDLPLNTTGRKLSRLLP
ncbi:A/G-specific adenine glycosylase [Candidatus Laterigemmans baculatus]|uniref:A/G-specific adenine glycosylase n=1 Tax=Candidatus Laterigemmans baculatus TaxID=2770505 RepID=UPI001F15D111|nr:A/G-specific adenine glycosylase [Candidatus Laterigemmans baculatus]